MNNPVAVLDEAYRFGPPTLVDVTTSQPTNADSAPTWQVYEDGSPMAGQSGTLSLLDSETGVYEGSFTPTAAAGFDPGKDYTLLIEAQVDGVVGKHKIGFVVGERLTQQLVADAMRIDGSGAPTADSVYAFASAAYTAAAAGASNAGSAATAATAVQAKLPAGGQSMAGATDLAAKASQASVNALPTAASVRQEMDANSTKLAKLDANVSDAVSAAEAVQTKLPSGGQTIAGADDLATVGDGIATSLTDIDQDPVAKERTVVLADTESEGLVGQFDYHLRVGDAMVFALDFRNALAVNDQISEVQEVTIVAGTAGGVTFGTAGRDHSQAKVRITGATAGTYVVEIQILSRSGNVIKGRATLVVSS